MADDEESLSDIRSVDEEEEKREVKRQHSSCDATNLMKTGRVLHVSWKRILSEFENRFDDVFENSISKAHLDLTEILVDGAKGKWRHVLLLDTIASFALKKEKSRAVCDRRRFDQYAALHEAVATAAAEAFIERCLRGQETNVPPERMVLVDMPQPWCDSALLRTHFLEDTTSKNWKMRRQAAEQLFSLPLIKDLGFVNCITLVVGQLYSQHFGADQKDPRLGVDRFAQQESAVHARCSDLLDFIRRQH